MSRGASDNARTRVKEATLTEGITSDDSDSLAGGFEAIPSQGELIANPEQRFIFELFELLRGKVPGEGWGGYSAARLQKAIEEEQFNLTRANGDRFDGTGGICKEFNRDAIVAWGGV